MDFDDDDDEPSAPAARPAFKFQPKAKPRLRKFPSSSAAPIKVVGQHHAQAASTNHESILTTQTNDGKSNAPGNSCDDAVNTAAGSGGTSPNDNDGDPNSGIAVSGSATVLATEELHANIGQGPSDGHNPHFDTQRSTTANADPFSVMESVGDFMSQPTDRTESRGFGLGDASEQADCAFPTDTYTDYLLNQEDLLEPSPGFGSDFPTSTDLATGFSHNQETEIPEPDVYVPEGIHSGEMTGLSEPLDNGLASFPSKGNETDSVPKPQRRRKVISQSDEVSINDDNGGGSTAEAGSQPQTDGPDNHGDCSNKEGDTSGKRKSSRRSKKDSTGNDKPARKRKQTTEASDELNAEQPPKKFPHSTRRRKRCVDKVLLETPEEDLDLQRLPIKDLIMLAEIRERQKNEASRDAEAAMDKPHTPVTTRTERVEDDNMWEDYSHYNYHEEDNQEQASFDNPSNSEVQMSTDYYNYHSHMNRTPRVRWSKQDTELFYQGVRQFGSDLSMIRELFPGRTRHQIKLKYKKEERQQPMRLQDALMDRRKDLTHFKQVIQRLQEQIDREENEQLSAQGEDSADAPGQEEGLVDNENTVETDASLPKEATESEQIAEEGAADVSENPKEEYGEVVTPDNKYVESEGDDDLDSYSEYKSTL